MQIEESRHYRFAFHHLGFRPFFLLGSLFSVVIVLAWLWVLAYGGQVPAIMNHTLSVVNWHGHEMLYGYTVAVIAGFLLTAVRNWTGVQTLNGAPLMLLVLCWWLARSMSFIPHHDAMLVMAVFDLLFNIVLCLAVLQPIVKVRQWKHMAIWTKVALLLVGNALFYLGAFGYIEEGVRMGLYTGLYIIISLIMLMARRVIPFFIEKGVSHPVQVTNYRWLDISSLVLMLAFMIVEVYVVMPVIATWLAAMLAVLHALRLRGWYTHGIWSKPLLWGLYLGYAWLVVGFALRAITGWSDLPVVLAVHAFAYGTIGLVTIGMMARVALGHTGRDVFNPPKLLAWLFVLLLTGSFVRIGLPVLFPEHYETWLMVSQWLWIAVFAGFSGLYAPMLVKPRIDGKFG